MIIKSITIENFKGIKSFTDQFNDKENSIYGINGSGKTTIKQAYFWCLGQDVKDVIPSKDNVEIPNLEIKVELKAEIDGVEYIFTRVQREKYKLDKTSGKKTKCGNESTFYIDNIENTLTEYKSKITNILKLEDYNQFLLLSDIEYFNSNTNNWKWNNRRSELLKHISVNDNELLNKEEYAIIRDDISKDNDITELKKSYKKVVDDLNKQKEKNMVLVEELEKYLDNEKDIDIEKCNKDLSKLEKERDNFYESQKEYQQVIKDYNLLNSNINSYDMQIQLVSRNLNDKKSSLANELNRINNQIDQLSSSSDKNLCPVCHSELNSSKLNDVIDNLNKSKEELTKKTNVELEKMEQELSTLNNKKDTLKFKLDLLVSEYNIKEIESKLNNNELMNINEEIVKTQSLIKDFNQLEHNANKVKELNESNMKFTEQSITYINKINALDNYNLDISKTITESVNKLFPDEISFALFDFANYRGDLENICVAMLNGKTYDECSSGEKYCLNFLITLTLQDIYNVNLPIWCDNYECLSQDLSTTRQMITLSVSGINDNNINKINKI